MVVHEPEGQTTVSALPKIRTNRSATGKASCHCPELKAGCPQHVCSSGKYTSTPMRRSTRTMSHATCGCIWSTKQGMKSATLEGMAAGVPRGSFVRSGPLYAAPPATAEISLRKQGPRLRGCHVPGAPCQEMYITSTV